MYYLFSLSKASQRGSRLADAEQFQKFLGDYRYDTLISYINKMLMFRPMLIAHVILNIAFH